MDGRRIHNLLKETIFGATRRFAAASARTTGV